MTVSYSCECGVVMEAEDVSPPTAELLWGIFTRDHPHSEARADAHRQEIRDDVERRWPDGSSDDT